ncbi:DUF6090 family protein [Muriicola sp. SD30]|uniref:DUF6090 family protein n=1 Tax=Muriicola sp. SD30 TaxID=3240936 RepID=UPI00350E96D9
MLNFFRRIRKRLAEDNQFKRYFRYAFGEVALIMIGIFMALQLQNWNEQRKEENEFNVILEQLYNAIIYDVDKFNNQLEYMTFQIGLMDQILNHPDSIPMQYMPYALYNGAFDNFKSYQSDAHFYANDLRSDYDNASRNELIKQITGYLNLIRTAEANPFEINRDILTDFLISEHLAYPELNREDLNEGWNIDDSLYYSPARLKRLQMDLKTEKYQATLKTYRSQKIAYRRGAQAKFNHGTSVLNLIKAYNPDVRVIYENVGIIGTSLDGYDDVGGKSTPMLRTDAEEGIWEAELYLKEGTVKFRCNDSWLRNWGLDFGRDIYLSGPAVPDGNNIVIEEEGNYHIVLNLSEFTYEFTKLD